MFLELFESLQHIINNILQFIENNSIFVGGLASVIVGSLWLRKFLLQKRAEAFFGFYAQLSLSIGMLKAKLEENDRLNVSDSEKGNIFSLIYVEQSIKTFCPSFTPITKEELELYNTLAMRVKNIIINSEDNVYPGKAKREEWYQRQCVILLFCEFLQNEGYRNTTNICMENDSTEPKHIIKCKELLNALNYIQDTINRTKY